jgi:hypothetical protein
MKEDKIKYTRKNLQGCHKLMNCWTITSCWNNSKLLEQLVTRCWVNNFVTTCQQDGNQQCERILMTSCWNNSKLLEQLVTSLLSQQLRNKALTTCRQDGNQQCERILMTSCWNNSKLLEPQLVTRCWVNNFVTTCQQDGNQQCERILMTSCWNNSKLLEQLVTSLLSQQLRNKALTTCRQDGNQQCERILMTSCWNNIATNLLQVCYNLCVFTCAHTMLQQQWDNHLCFGITWFSKLIQGLLSMLYSIHLNNTLR